MKKKINIKILSPFIVTKIKQLKGEKVIIRIVTYNHYKRIHHKQIIIIIKSTIT